MSLRRHPAPQPALPLLCQLLLLATADGRNDGHFISCLQLLLLIGSQVLLVQAEHKAALQLCQLGVLQAPAAAAGRGGMTRWVVEGQEQVARKRGLAGGVAAF